MDHQGKAGDLGFGGDRKKKICFLVAVMGIEESLPDGGFCKMLAKLNLDLSFP
jgi:hypothetical protein